MTYARKTLVSLKDTSYYHVIARCVRRAWLWGVDEYAGRDYSHRKEWVLERLAQLSGVFAVDICAYAIMSNHYHLVVHVDAELANRWSPQEVLERWCRMFSKPALIDRWQQGMCSDVEREIAESIIELWRRRLCDVSWYMRSLNEHLARRANAEDQCTGRFWEGRFKSQALLDDAGLLTAMAYVDLNPIRAAIADTPEESEYTSIYERIKAVDEATQENKTAARASGVVPPLRSFAAASVEQSASAIPFTLRDYLELVDWTGRSVRSDKRASINPRLPTILTRLKFDADVWCHAMRPDGNTFGRAVGRAESMQLHAQSLRQSWIRGTSAARRLFA